MREEGNRPAKFIYEKSRLNIYLFIFLCSLLTIGGEINAQCKPAQSVFHNGEQLDYDIYFKWGLIMPKAGMATFRMKDTQYESKKAWNYNLVFRTNGIFEKIYKMRDTLECYFTPTHQLYYSSKRTNESGKYVIENITFTPKGSKTQTHTHRFNSEVTRIDTTIITAGCVYDMIAASLFLRSIDWSNLTGGEEFSTKVAIGRDIVNMSFRYTGQAIVERGENLKYRTRHFYVDIYDDAFTQSKEAAEVWIGDDENHIPVRVRAKLKVGAAEVYYNSSQGLKHPFTSRIEIPKR